MILAHAMLYILPTFPIIMLGVVYAAEHPRPRGGDLRIKAGTVQVHLDGRWRNLPSRLATA